MNKEQVNAPMEKTKDLMSLLIAALIGGGGASLGLNLGTDPRPDPFTGTEGRALKEQVRAIENHIHDVRFELGRDSRAMPEVRALGFRIQSLELKCEEVEACCEKNGG